MSVWEQHLYDVPLADRQASQGHKREQSNFCKITPGILKPGVIIFVHEFIYFSDNWDLGSEDGPHTRKCSGYAILCSDAKERVGAESNRKLLHLFIPSKTATLFPEFAVEDLPLDRTATLVPALAFPRVEQFDYYYYYYYYYSC